MKTGIKLFLLGMLLACGALPLPGQRNPYDSGGPLIFEQAAFDVLHYDLNLLVEPGDSTVDGRLVMTATILSPVPRIVLDLVPELDVVDVRFGGGRDFRQATFERSGGEIWITLPDGTEPGDIVTVMVEYGGRAGTGRARGFSWGSTPDGSPWITTAVEMSGADIWFPVKDHSSDEPDSMSLHITVPEPLVVASNGVLREVTEASAGYRTYHWFVANPINNYGVALNIAPYVTVDTVFTSVSGETMPVIFWVLPRSEARGRAFLPEILDHLRFFEEVAGPYPFRNEKYGVAEVPYLGMEHQTIIAYGADFNNGAMTRGNDFGFDALHQHELAHEWYGNLMTAADWKDLWLHEGFAQYMQPLYVESRQGEAAYREYMAFLRRGLDNEQAVAPRETQTARQIYNGDIYNKGAWILHTLRNLIGDGPFRVALRRLAYPNPAMETVTDGRQAWWATTEDFVDIAEAASGMDLGWFFEVYVRQPEPPRLVATMEDGYLSLRWEVPDGLPFFLPVEVSVDGDVTLVDMADGRGGLPVGSGAVVIIDPNVKILKEGGADTGGGS